MEWVYWQREERSSHQNFRRDLEKEGKGHVNFSLLQTRNKSAAIFLLKRLSDIKQVKTSQKSCSASFRRNSQQALG